jgi:hypothetical protein
MTPCARLTAIGIDSEDMDSPFPRPHGYPRPIFHTDTFYDSKCTTSSQVIQVPRLCDYTSRTRLCRAAYTATPQCRQNRSDLEDTDDLAVLGGNNQRVTVARKLDVTDRCRFDTVNSEMTVRGDDDEAKSGARSTILMWYPGGAFEGEALWRAGMKPGSEGDRGFPVT